jgi:hypothetical protein
VGTPPTGGYWSAAMAPAADWCSSRTLSARTVDSSRKRRKICDGMQASADLSVAQMTAGDFESRYGAFGSLSERVAREALTGPER